MSNIKTGDILNFDYTGAVQSITLPKGIYKLECWGAQGGYSSSNSGIEVGMGGKGGYSAGTTASPLPCIVVLKRRKVMW